jgi:hypothetical protein
MKAYSPCADYLDALAHFPRYLENAWHDLGDGRGFFGDPSHLEAGMRSTGNVIFTAALLASDPEYRPHDTTGNRDLILGKARASLAYMTQAHVTGGGVCADGQPWGGVWQSSWWTTRMALGAKLIWDHLDKAERAAVERVVVYEADLQLPRLVPSGLAEDTKAEENAWDTEILATALGLFPEHPHCGNWRHKLCAFAYNTFSVAADHADATLADGKPLREWVHTVNLHSDFTLENHGAYHFCYVASPLHSLSWSDYALRSQGITPPDALFHHVAEVWQRVKSTFLTRRFAYVSGQDWARYTYGAYFIVPALVWLQSRLGDGDARAIELARLQTLCEEQRENADGSWFGRRFTQPHYAGQPAKYETDCYANIGLAYALHRLLLPPVAPTPVDELPARLNGCHVSPECGIAFVRTERLFASFSWRTLTEPHPLALFVPLADESLAEWQAHNLLGRIVLWRENPSAVWVRGMEINENGFNIEGTVIYRGRGGRILYTQELRYTVDAVAKTARIRSRFVAQAKVFVRRAEGLCLAIANDRFNGYTRTVTSTSGPMTVRFDPAERPFWLSGRGIARRILRRLLRETLHDGPRHCIDGHWVNVDGLLGIVAAGDVPGFVLHRPYGRNLPDGSLHYDMLYAPLRPLNRHFKAGEEILNTDVLLLGGDAAATQAVAETLMQQPPANAIWL